jgi:hypothetical protein
MRGLGKRLTVIASATVAVMANVTVAHAGGTTYTIEPFDYDDVGSTVMNITQQQLGGTLCPCVKISYPADGLAQNRPPPGVRFVLLGDTPTHNSQMVALGQGVPPTSRTR